MARESNETRANCLTNHLTAFSAQFYVVPNKIDFDQGFTGLQPDNMAVLCTVCLIFAFYAVGLMVARKADNRDKMKVGFCCCLYQTLNIVCTEFKIIFGNIL